MREAPSAIRALGPTRLKRRKRRRLFQRQAWIAALAVSLPWCLPALGDDWPQFGRDNTRNAVSREKHPPTIWDIGQYDEKVPPERIPGTSKNIKWSARLGTQTVGDPVVVDGLVWIGTNNGYGEDQPDASVLACFRESDGKLLYRYVSPRLVGRRDNDWPHASLACSPLIEGDRLWFVTNRAEVICLDIGPLKQNEAPPQTLWKVDLIAKYGVYPSGSRMTLMRLCSIAGYCDMIYLVTGNDADIGKQRVVNPDAPSLLCLRKDNGAEVWQDKSPGENILCGQWSSPTVVEIDTRVQCIVGQGDGWVRSFDALTGEPIWQFDMNHKESKWAIGGRSTRNSIVASPVFADGRIYIASGQYVELGEGNGRLVCLDPTRNGDISSELAVDTEGKIMLHRRVQAVDRALGETAVPNPNSGLVWEFEKTPENDNPFEDYVHRMLANVTVNKGLVIACDFSGLVHCFDANTGKRYWAYDVMDAIYGSPLIVDDKVYIVGEGGSVSIFGLSADPNWALRRLNGVDEPRRQFELVRDRYFGCYCSPIFANGVLYLATRNELFAISAGPDEPNIELTGGYWPQWRGPSRDNVSSETGLLQEWPAEGPPRLWTAAGLGDGIASVAVAEGKIFTVGYQDDSEFVVALREASGELAWATRLGPAVAENPLMRWLIQRVPTVDDERLYAFTAGGDVICLDSHTGKEIWRKSYTADFGAKRPIFGFGDFPLVDEERLICTVGAPVPQVVALDKKTGAVVWTTHVQGGEARIEDYGATVLVDVGGTPAYGGVRQYVTSVNNQLTGIAQDGRILWTYTKPASIMVSPHTPMVRGNRVFASSGNAGVLLKLVRDGDRVTAEKEFEWKFNSDRFQDSNVLIGDHLFYSRGPGILACNAWPSGEAVWAERLPSSGSFSFTCADGCLYLLGASGQMLLVPATPESYKSKGEFAVPDYEPARGATAPVLADGRLYLRSNARLHCYDVRADRQAATAPARSVTLPKLLGAAGQGGSTAGVREARVPNGVYVPTPHDVVKRMLKLAELDKTDVVYDLGCGDGRIVIAAAKDYGCRAFGYDIDAELVAIARQEAQKQGVEKLVTIERGDLFGVDLTKADVVTLYLLPEQNEKLVAQFKTMRPGARIVAHQFRIPGLVAASSVDVTSEESGERHTLYLYRIAIETPPD